MQCAQLDRSVLNWTEVLVLLGTCLLVMLPGVRCDAAGCCVMCCIAVSALAYAHLAFGDEHHRVMAKACIHTVSSATRMHHEQAVNLDDCSTTDHTKHTCCTSSLQSHLYTPSRQHSTQIHAEPCLETHLANGNPQTACCFNCL